ncbi:MAG: GTPase Era [Alphaproteobacteria bacterium]|nr:GTPase Era [Alphaproteobacteria bacterium]MCZ6837739.1 GTPase Era [Alphaproteobacteria bacterium]
MPTDATQCGVVAVIGVPNAGKSTLVNQFVGAKVTIVTHKVQTTRSRIRGIAIVGSAQVIYVDTPGIFAPRRRLERAMVDAAWSGAADADIVVLVVDARRGANDEVVHIIDGLNEKKRPAVLALNKIDTVKRETLLSLAEQLNGKGLFDEVFMVSALNGDGVDDLQAYLAAKMPSGPWLFPEDQLSDLPQRLLAAEITREKAYLYLHQELPYSLAVDTEDWQDFKDGSVRIGQVVYVERESQKGIVLGKGGQTIKRIRSEAQQELAELLERPIHLFIHVKVRENWVNDPGRYREWGLRYDA